MQQFEYNELFLISIRSSESGDETFENIQYGKNGRILQDEDGDEQKTDEKFSFKTKVVAHTSKEIQF